MAVLGALAIVFGFLDRVPSLLMWIYLWGESVAWVLKFGFLIGGGAIWVITKRMMAPETEEIDTAEEQQS